jgi:alpha-tubulin suppressor-like RCC1 family protein
VRIAIASSALLALALGATVATAPACSNLVGIDDLQGCRNSCNDEVTRTLCTADEAPRIERCPADLPHCTGEGRCVRCIADSDCPTEPNEDELCMRAQCIQEKCARGIKEKATCGRDKAGVCNAAGVCMGSDVVLAALRQHTCLRAHDGKVYCWGENPDGELGDGTRENKGVPVRVKNLPFAKRVVAGYAHTCAIVEDDSVWCWGSNKAAQVANGVGPSDEPVVKPSRVREDLPPIRSITAGFAHSCALTLAGEVWCWGLNDLYQCGRQTPLVLPRAEKLPDVTNAVYLEANQNHTCVIRSVPPYLQCWGSNDNDQFAPSSVVASAKPIDVALPSDAPPIAIALSWESTCAIASGVGEVYCRGKNAKGQLGNGSTSADPIGTPQRVVFDRFGDGRIEPLTSAREIFRSDGSHVCVKTNFNPHPYFCWGEDEDGELGQGAAHVGKIEGIARPATALPSRTITMAHGEDHACILVTGANEVPEVLCYGQENYLGIGTPTPANNVDVPHPIPTPIKWDPAFLE